MTAPALLLAKKWEPGKVDPTGWWISEKLDGVRAYWDGTKFISRLGHEFYAPEWFREQLPTVPLDGELFTGRKDFQNCVSIVRTQDGDPARWTKVTYRVFDMPIVQPIPFEQRMKSLAGVIEGRGNHIVQVPQYECKGIEHLYRELAGIQKVGGEGLMLRQPGSLYVGKRSSTLLKVKTFLDDEAVVVGHQPGEGKHKGRLGALIVGWPLSSDPNYGALTYRTFGLGTGFSDAERENPPAIGEKVTFRYFELSNDGVPRFPTYVGRAIDK